jgi:hypothetical protein
VAHDPAGRVEGEVVDLAEHAVAPEPARQVLALNRLVGHVQHRREEDDRDREPVADDGVAKQADA